MQGVLLKVAPVVCLLCVCLWAWGPSSSPAGTASENRCLHRIFGFASAVANWGGCRTCSLGKIIPTFCENPCNWRMNNVRGLKYETSCMVGLALKPENSFNIPSYYLEAFLGSCQCWVSLAIGLEKKTFISPPSWGNLSRTGDLIYVFQLAGRQRYKNSKQPFPHTHTEYYIHDCKYSWKQFEWFLQRLNLINYWQRLPSQCCGLANMARMPFWDYYPQLLPTSWQ